jgi:hypothetical protein
MRRQKRERARSSEEKKDSARGALDQTSLPVSGVGQGSGLQRSGTTPGGGPGATMGSLGTGGGSTAAAATGNLHKSRMRRPS